MSAICYYASATTAALPRSRWRLLAVLVLLIGIPHAAANAQNQITVQYLPPHNQAHTALYVTLRAKNALEKLQEIFSPFRLPTKVVLSTLPCDGQSNAWYYHRVIGVCYEYLDGILKQTSGSTQSAPPDAVFGQFFYVFAHEMGHAVFDQLAIPVFGRGEDAADQFAVYMMLQFGKEDARRLIVGAAYSYKDAIANPVADHQLKLFSDAHGVPAQRFYNLLCIAYGADPVLFADFVEKGYLPKERASGCKREYGEVAYAFQSLILPHLDQELAKALLKRSWLPSSEKQPTSP